jgi:hypothetical protein
MRDPRAGARLPALQLPNRRTRRGSRRTNLLLRPLRARGRQDAVKRPRLSLARETGEQLLAAFSSWRLFPMPRLRYVLDPWLALIADQNERQSVSIRSAKFIHSRASARFRGWPYPTGLLNGHSIACHGIVAPDLCLWPGSHDVKCTVRIDCPDSTKRVAPRAGERRGARRSRRARGYQTDQRAREKKFEKGLYFHAAILPGADESSQAWREAQVTGNDCKNLRS